MRERRESEGEEGESEREDGESEGEEGERERGREPHNNERCKGLWVIRARVDISGRTAQSNPGENTEKGE